MKKLFFMIVFSFCFYSKLEGAFLFTDSPILGYGTPVTVSISTSAWTKVPTSQTSGRLGVYLSLPATATANMVGHLGDCTSTAIATTVRPLEIIRSEQSLVFPIREDVCLWILSIHTSAESIHYQEIKR